MAQINELAVRFQHWAFRD